MTSIKVSGMSCGHCVASVTKVLEDMAGISAVSIELSSGTVQFDNSGNVPITDIKEAITKIGFTPED